MVVYTELRENSTNILERDKALRNFGSCSDLGDKTYLEKEFAQGDWGLWETMNTATHDQSTSKS